MGIIALGVMLGLVFAVKKSKKKMGVRADKFVWAVRLAKTRTDAADALKGGRILLNGIDCKPSREIKVGDTISVKRMPALFSFKVKELLERRVGAKLVADYLEDITPDSELEKLEMARYASSGVRDRGTGRPTKRDRREIENFFAENDDDM